jgi:glyoxylate utilization-related uncharacterized protein
MKTRDIRDLVWFSEDEARTEVLTDTSRIWSQVICLQGAQGLGPMRDETSEGLLTVLAGEVSAQLGKGRSRMRQWETLSIEPGEELTVRNASAEPAVVLLVLAPPPAR